MNEVSFGDNDRLIDFEGSGHLMVQQKTDTAVDYIRMFSYLNSTTSTFDTSTIGSKVIVQGVINNASSSFQENIMDIGGVASVDEIILANRDAESAGGNIALKEFVITDLLTTTERAKVIERLTTLI